MEYCVICHKIFRPLGDEPICDNCADHINLDSVLEARDCATLGMID